MRYQKNDIIPEIRKLNIAIEAMTNNYLRQYGLTISQCTLLFRLIENEENGGEMLNQRDLESYMNMSNPAITGIITRLEMKGLAERIKDAGDKRSNRIVPTAAGMSLKEAISDYIEKSEAMVLNGISEEEKAVLWNVIMKMQHNVEKE